MSRPSPSAANDIPRLLDKLSSADDRDAFDAFRALAALAATDPREALRLAQDDALPAIVQAIRSPNEAVAAHAGLTLATVAVVAPDLVADAASSTLVAVLRKEDGRAAAAAAMVRATAPHCKRVTCYCWRPTHGHTRSSNPPLHDAQTTNRCLVSSLNATPRSSPPGRAYSRRCPLLFAAPRSIRLPLRHAPSANAPRAAPA